MHIRMLLLLRSPNAEYFLCVEDKLTVNFLHKFVIFLKEEMDSVA